MMHPYFAPDRFSDMSAEQQVAKCRDMANIAERLASIREGAMQQAYLHLAERWRQLADEMELAARGHDHCEA
jgi:hypothetical protein